LNQLTQRPLLGGRNIDLTSGALVVDSCLIGPRGMSFSGCPRVLTIVGGGRRESCGRRRRRGTRLCACGASPAQWAGPSTSPLDAHETTLTTLAHAHCRAYVVSAGAAAFGPPARGRKHRDRISQRRAGLDLSPGPGMTLPFRLSAGGQSSLTKRFAPASHPAHPAVVKRVVRARPGGGSDVNMSVLCEASKEACDQLVREFDAMNRRLPALRQ
jgi:hypothetical protein